MNTFNAAALFAANCRPRQLKLSPRAFHLLARGPIRSCQQRRKGNLSLVKSLPVGTRGSQQGNYSTSASIPPSSQETSDAFEEDDLQAEADGEDIFSSSDGQSLDDILHRNKTIFKTWMRTVPKSVAIITARRQDVEDKAAGTVGATVSSFNTVAFEPDVYVSFNLKQDSLTLRTILETKHFCANFPNNTQFGSQLAADFAKMDGPSTKIQYWNDSQYKSYFASRGINRPPCRVSKKGHSSRPHSAIVFAAWYEYHSSIAVGDHVIVTGKALPILSWTGLPAGNATPIPETPFFTTMQTLGHVHGRFTDGVTTTFDTSYMLDDKFRGDGSASTEKMLEFYTARLELLGLYMTEGVYEESPAESTLIAKLHPEQRSQYVRYYMARVAMLQSQGELSIERLPDLINKLAPWEQHQVRHKKLLTLKQMEVERQTCIRRLLVLESGSHTDPKDLDGADGQIVEAADDLSDGSHTHRIGGLRFYWQTRLRHICIAQLEKILLVVNDSGQRNLYDYLNGTERKFVAARRDWPVVWLQRSHEQYVRIMSKLRKEVMRAWAAKQVETGKKDKLNSIFVDQAFEQLSTLNRKSNILSWLIARRTHLDNKAEIQGELVLPRIPSDAEIQKFSKSNRRRAVDPKEFTIEASTKIKEARDREISQEEFDDLLTDVMSNSKSKKQGQEGS